MPEYLAPGVYVEEVDTGSKPIEGVSTSTSGMVGVTERGPANVPVLVTSVGEFSRWFGGQLRIDDYGTHRFLPHAIEGFFGNGGKRVFVVRALDEESATKATSPLFDRGDAASIVTTLLRSASEGTGTAVSPPGLLVLPVAGLAANDWVRIGDGSRAEYRQAAGPTVAEDTMVPVNLPLSRSHANTEQAFQFTRATLGAAINLTDPVEPGATSLSVTGATADINATAGQCIEIGGTLGEYRFVSAVTQVVAISATNSNAVLTLDTPLQLPYPSTATLIRINLGGAPSGTANIVQAVGGDGLFYVDARGGQFNNRTRLVRLNNVAGSSEVRRIGQLSQLSIAPGDVAAYPVGSTVEAVTFSPNRALVAGSTTTVLNLGAGEAADLAQGERLVVDPGGTPATVAIQSINTATDAITVTPPLAAAPAAGIVVVPLAKSTTAAASAGGKVLAVDDRMGLAEGQLLRVGSGATSQVVAIVAIPTLSFVAPDPGNIVVYPPLSAAWPTGTPVAIVGSATPVVGRQATAVALPAVQGSTDLYVTDGAGFVANDVIRVTTAGGDVTFHTLTGGAAPIVPEVLNLTSPLARAHTSGSDVVQREPLFDVEALDAGIWGNRLRISIQDETPGLVTQTTLASIVNPTSIRLASASGIQAGTVLELFDPVTGTSIGDPVKVSNLNRAANFLITLAGAGLSAAQQVPNLIVRSREFKLTVTLLRQPDPSTPSRNEQALDVEVFRYLSMDSRHSNYIEKIIGDIDGPLRKWDHRPEGSSLYIRVRDLAPNQAEEESIRLGPEALLDTLRDGRRVPALQRLEQTLGFDSIGTITDATYIGADNVDPDLRTGLQSLLNVEEVSIVAVPGQTGVAVQQAIIDHCEFMRYRFAVLDSTPEPDDTITDVQDQRQQFDTKYAALYYPWLAIPDPFPANLANIQEYPVPPSGHVIGIYARIDIERGVHKAPANEVVRGIVNLRRKINKEQQDILNPFPVNINVIRDFRDHNRGIRVYGARVITSDSDWKYVNVRRLLIFIEASIDRGLQWVVFEPNAEPLWARVRRSVINFLTVVWRNGALEGTKPEEAFYVKCDRTTMTQTDIDSGRLIVLVGVAPVKPAEFVVVRIGLWTARSDT
jgi:hypothetical protein